MSDIDPMFERDDLTLTLDVNPRQGRLFMAALTAFRGRMLPDLDGVLVAATAVAVYLDGPNPTKPGQSFHEQLMDAIPGEAWDQFYPVEAMHFMAGIEAAMRAVDPSTDIGDEDE